VTYLALQEHHITNNKRYNILAMVVVIVSLSITLPIFHWMCQKLKKNVIIIHTKATLQERSYLIT